MSEARDDRTVLITGGAGYIGSLLTGLLLQRGHRVIVADDLLFGGESLLAYWHHPRFRFVKGDVHDAATLRRDGDCLVAGNGAPERVDAIVHLAAIVGFPACQAIGQQASWRYNVETTRRVFELADAAGVERF